MTLVVAPLLLSLTLVAGLAKRSLTSQASGQRFPPRPVKPSRP